MQNVCLLGHTVRVIIIITSIIIKCVVVYVCDMCADEREKLIMYFLIGLLIGGISVLLVVNIYLMIILCRHRRQLRAVGVQPVSSRLGRGRRKAPSTTSAAEPTSFVDSGRASIYPPPSSSPEMSRRAGRRSRRTHGPLEVSTPTVRPGQVQLPPRDSPVFVHVESPRESPVLGRAAPVPAVDPESIDVSPPPSDSTIAEASPVWVRVHETPPSDATLPLPDGERPGVLESPVWVHFAFDETPSVTLSTTTAAVVPVVDRSSTAVSSASTLAGPPVRARAAAVVYPAHTEPLPSVSETSTLSRSYSNPYRQDTYRRSDRPTGAAQRPRQRRLLRFD